MKFVKAVEFYMFMNRVTNAIIRKELKIFYLK